MGSMVRRCGVVGERGRYPRAESGRTAWPTHDVLEGHQGHQGGEGGVRNGSTRSERWCEVPTAIRRQIQKGARPRCQVSSVRRRTRAKARHHRPKRMEPPHAPPVVPDVPDVPSDRRVPDTQGPRHGHEPPRRRSRRRGPCSHTSVNFNTRRVQCSRSANTSARSHGSSSSSHSSSSHSSSKP